MLLKKATKLLGFLVMSSFLLGAMVSISPTAYASTASATYSGPTLRLPWLSGTHQISGYSYNCGDHTGKDQYAIDFDLRNEQVTAVFDGTVHIGQFDPNGYGNNLWVTNGQYRAVYAHLSSIQVTEGQSVTQGQILGISGSTGRSTAPHLHFSLRNGGTGSYDGTAVMPEPMSGYTGFSHYGYTYDKYQGYSDQYGPVCGFNNQGEPAYDPGAVPSSSPTINFSVTMPGISNTSGNNNSPKHPSRTATVQIKDANSNVVQTISTTVIYSQNTGAYSGSANAGTLSSGAYTVSVKLSNSLSKQFPGFFTSPVATVNEPGLALVSGDINGDNVLDILDYNDLLSCFGSKFPTCQFNPSADLNDDGVVDGIDYNIWLRDSQTQPPS